MKKLVFTIFAVSLGFTILSCKRSKTLELVMAESNPSDTISAKSDAIFVKAVEELSGGTIKINLFTDSLLGDNSTVLNEMTKKESGIHLASMSTSAIARYECPKTKLLDVPYTFKDRTHFWNFAESETAKQILDEPYVNGTGIKGLFFTEEGLRHFFSTTKISDIRDLKGKKIRIAGKSLLEEIIKALGGKPISIKFSVLYSALQVGDVDVAEQPIVNYYSNNFNKIAPFVFLDGHQFGIREIIITSQLWDSLSAKQKQIFIEAGLRTQEYCKSFSNTMENLAIVELIKEGAEFTQIEDITPLRELCADVIKNAISGYTETYNEIINFAD